MHFLLKEQDVRMILTESVKFNMLLLQLVCENMITVIVSTVFGYLLCSAIHNALYSHKLVLIQFEITTRSQIINFLVRCAPGLHNYRKSLSSLIRGKYNMSTTGFNIPMESYKINSPQSSLTNNYYIVLYVLDHVFMCYSEICEQSRCQARRRLSEQAKRCRAKLKQL